MFGLIRFSGFRGEDLNVIFYQNMHNLHNRLKEKFDRKTGIHVKLLLAMELILTDTNAAMDN